MTVFKEISEDSVDIVNTITEKQPSFFSEFNSRISENLDGITRKIHNLEQRSLDLIVQFKQDVTKITNQASESLKANLTETTNNLTDQITLVTEKSKESIHESLKKAETVSDSLSEKFNLSFNDFLDNWIQEHPLLHWLVIHPIWGIIILALSLFLIFSLWQISFEIVKQIIIFILRTPWLISKFFLSKSFNQPLKNNRYYEQNHINILQKLDAIEQKQQAILEQLSNFNSK
jgi:Fe2+ transport system protein B